MSSCHAGLNVAVASMLACSDANLSWNMALGRDKLPSKTRGNTEISCSSGDGTTEYMSRLCY